MAINPLKIFLLAAGGSAAAATVAYVSGALDPYLAPPAAIASLPAPATTTPTADKPADPAKPAAGAEAPATVAPAPAAPAAAAAVIAPSFDVVRVENNGSVVIAGKAAGNSKVEIVTGSKVIGAAVAGADGDFAVVLNDPLKPGDYQIVLRATAPDNVVATSTETAVVSVPSDPGGQVLALVEEPGKPAQLITVPKPADAPSAPATAEQQASAPATAPAAEPAPAKSAAPAAEIKVAVEAVEIEGKKIFIAGSADAGRKVRAYANEILIGETQTSPEGRFLIEAERELPVGDYIIRVDALEPNGAKVVARAAVPFQREPGEAVAAVAPQPTAPAAPAVDATAPAAASTAEAKTAMAGEVPAKPADPAAEATAPAQATAPAATADKPAEVAAAPATAEVTAPKLEAVNGAVIIRRGDSLWRISRRVYGHGVRYSNIYLANQDQIQDPDRIWPGQVFRVPEKSKEGEAANMGAMGEQAMPAPKP
ncbi:LysM peptidoglycan-binding domain-containing protein [Aminobacter sp. BA135]|uniref:LysM peptidoglycan-binding domain-containing protein n=1 Tax=Aminobacter sp. BA135 TaxID=537596 RepID=UPI003D7BC0D9